MDEPWNAISHFGDHEHDDDQRDRTHSLEDTVLRCSSIDDLLPAAELSRRV